MYKKIVLDNGLRVVLSPMSGRESATIGLWVVAGSRNEDKRLSGISHFLEHMVFKGTPTRSSRKLKEEIEGRGGSLNAFTSEEMTCYLAKVSGRHLNRAIDVLSDIVLHANMKQKDIDCERPVIIEEIKMYQDLPPHHVHDILNELMWPHHSLGFSVAGDIKSVSSIRRQDLLDYKKRNYTARNAVLVLCGNFNHDSVVKNIKKAFCASREKEPKGIIKYVNRQNSSQVKILHKGTAQTRLSMGMHTFGRMHEDRYVLSLLHVVLGANMSSRLFENIREKRGLAYEIGTEIKRYRETGAFIVNAGIEHGKIKEAVSLIIRELRKVKEKLVSGKELKRAKEFLKVQFLLALEDTMDHMLWLGESVISSGVLPDKKDIIKKIDTISSEDLQRIAKDIFNDRDISLAVIGPLKDTEKKEIEKELEL